MLNAIYLLTTMLNTLNMWITIVNINFVIFLSGLIEKKAARRGEIDWTSSCSAGEFYLSLAGR
jgi:hypothetical protein